MSDAKILSYDDIVVFESDIRSLQGHAWLTDNIVNFAGNYMRNELISDQVREKICIVYASYCELIKYTDQSQLAELLSSFGVATTKWNIFMFNDNTDPNKPYGGTHWSLLLYHPMEKSFYLFDSSYSALPKHIEEFIAKLADALNLVNPITRVYECPKMGIAGDCGLFMVEYLRIILEHINGGNTDAAFKFPKMDNGFVNKQRTYWKNIIYTLAKKTSK